MQRPNLPPLVAIASREKSPDHPTPQRARARLPAPLDGARKAV